jgi:hypothetical protein
MQNQKDRLGPPPKKTLITIIYLFILWCIRIFGGKFSHFSDERIGIFFLIKKFAKFL